MALPWLRCVWHCTEVISVLPVAGRTQTVVTGNFSCLEMELSVGVPQGPVLGPQFFSICCPLNSIIRNIRARETLLCWWLSSIMCREISRRQSCGLPWRDSQVHCREWCMDASYNFLKLKIIRLRSCSSAPHDRWRRLMYRLCSRRGGVYFSILHCGQLVPGCNTESEIEHVLSCQRFIRPLSPAHFSQDRPTSVLEAKTAERLLHAFLASKLDMRIALLHGLPDIQIKRLQKLQNHAAHFVTGTSGSEHK